MFRPFVFVLALGILCVAPLVTRAEEAPAKQGFSVVVKDRYLWLPVRNEGTRVQLAVLVDGVPVRQLDFAPALEGAADWQAFDDYSDFVGKTLRIEPRQPLAPEVAAKLPGVFQFGPVALKEGEDYREAGRPQFHFTARRGWLNDPNGLAYFNGEYHLFYQANPLGLGKVGVKCWGHAVSRDLAHWEELSVALHPVTGGAHSGGAFVDRQNSLGFGRPGEDALIVSYTGDGERLAMGTGRALELKDLPGNPVLKHRGRDPKIFRYEPGKKWVMVVYEEAEVTGYAFYDSHDLKSWRRMFTIEGGNECPEFFEMPVEHESTRKWVLYGCEVRKNPPGGNKSAYMIGEFDGEKFTPETPFLKGHGGYAFYAAQTFANEPAGRRIMVAWLQGAVFPGMPFTQAMTVPLELTLRRTAAGLRLCFAPVTELERLRRGEPARGEGTPAQANALLAEKNRELLDVRMAVEPGDSGQFSLDVRGCVVTVDAKAGTLRCRDRKAAFTPGLSPVPLRVLVDRGALEVFAGEGEAALAFGGSETFQGEGPLRLQAGADARVKTIEVAEMGRMWDSAAAGK
jgi:fructan beta-fructosidase